MDHMDGINERCPFQAECGLRCAFENREIECPYYASQAYGELTIPDQEARRAELRGTTRAGENPNCPAQSICRKPCEYIGHEQECAYRGGADPHRNRNEPEPEPEDPNAYSHGPEVVQIPVERLYTHPDNPRRDVGDVTELAESVKRNGVLQNLTVVPLMAMREDGVQEYTVIIGHRRLAAAKLAGAASVPCVIVDMDREQQIATMLSENIQRQALTTYEEAKGFEQLRIDFGKSVSEIATAYGFSETTVRSRLKLAKLDPEKFQAAEERGGRLQDYAALDQIEDPDTRNEVLDKIGTANFENALRKAVNHEAAQKQIAAWEEQAAKFARKIENPDWRTMRQVMSAETWRTSETPEITAPDDAKERKYYYVLSPYGVTVYTDQTEEDEETDAEEAERARRQAAHEEQVGKLKEITVRHFELRRDFIKNLHVKKEHFPTIHILCVECFFGINEYTGSAKADPGILGDTTHEEIGKALRSKATWEERKQAAFEAAGKRGISPEKLLLCTAYSTLDNRNLVFWKDNWNGEERRYEVQHYKEGRLGRLYDVLIQIGYKMSDEEVQMQDGTHPLLTETEEGAEK